MNTNETTVKAEGFGVKDAKGREIGGCYSVYFVPARDEVRYSEWSSSPATKACFAMDPHCTRDGKDFGAVPVSAMKSCQTFEAAVAAGEAYLASARARAIKAAAKLAK